MRTFHPRTERRHGVGKGPPRGSTQTSIGARFFPNFELLVGVGIGEFEQKRQKQTRFVRRRRSVLEFGVKQEKNSCNGRRR
jgi:hypothetical protein